MSDIRVSSFCHHGGCVEVAFNDDWIQVSDTSGYRHVLYTFDEWRAFIAGVKNGEFDVCD